MTKKRELIYSAQTSGFVPGKAYANPRFFSTPRSDVSKVLLVGGWPKVEAAYLAAGIPVEHIDAPAIVAPVPMAPPIVKSVTPEALSAVQIPDDWRDLPWTKAETEGGLTLRSLASSVSTVPVLNKAQATAAVEAEIARRAASEA